MVAVISNKTNELASAKQAITRGLKDTLWVATGSAAGQLIVVLTMPIISRLYSPSEMGLYAIFTASIGLFSVVAALHYELAIPLPKSDFHAQLLTKLALSIVAVLGGVFAILLGTVGDKALRLLGATQLGAVAWFMPVSFVATGLAMVLTCRAIRFKVYRLTALGKLMQGIAQPITQMTYGLWGSGASGLVYGTLAGQCAAVFVLARNGLWRDLALDWQSHKNKLLVLISKYKDFPMASAPSSLVNAAVAQFPVIALAAWFDIRIAGLYALGVRIVQVPLRFLGDSLSQVLLGMAVEAYRSGHLEGIVRRISQAQTAFALHSFVPIAIVAPELFSVFFGEEWREAGVYTQLIIPWIIVSFVATSLSVLITVLQKQRQELLFQLAYLGSLAVALWLGYVGGSEYLAIRFLGLAASALLSSKVVWLLRISGVNLKAQFLWLLREVLYVASIAVTLLLFKIVVASELFIVITAITWIAIAHSVNHFVRNVYAF